MDAVTAAKDLQELGVNYTQEQLDRIKRAEEQRLRQRRMEREAKERKRLAALYDPKTDVPPDVAKIEFVLSMLDKLIDENGHLQPEDRSLIAASLKNIYKPLIASGYTEPCPTLGDLYRDLNKSNLRRAKQLALMLDVFANGSLQAFSHTTNVDMNNRLICFNIQSLGDQLRPIAMMSLLEFINMQVMTNRRKDATAATWIYFDEIHVLLKDPMSSNFLYSSWKRFRKYNAYATGISQDIQDYLDNPVAYCCFPTASLSLCCGKLRVWMPWKVCTGYPTRSWNFCATPARDTVSSRWATVYYHSPIWNPRIVMSISSSQRNREKGRSRNDFA